MGHSYEVKSVDLAESYIYSPQKWGIKLPFILNYDDIDKLFHIKFKRYITYNMINKLKRYNKIYYISDLKQLVTDINKLELLYSFSTATFVSKYLALHNRDVRYFEHGMDRGYSVSYMVYDGFRRKDNDMINTLSSLIIDGFNYIHYTTKLPKLPILYHVQMDTNTTNMSSSLTFVLYVNIMSKKYQSHGREA
jgi:hypothetical protein